MDEKMLDLYFKESFYNYTLGEFENSFSVIE